MQQMMPSLTNFLSSLALMKMSQKWRKEELETALKGQMLTQGWVQTAKDVAGATQGPYGHYWKPPEPKLQSVTVRDSAGRARPLSLLRYGTQLQVLPETGQWGLKKAGPDDPLFREGTSYAVDSTGVNKPVVMQQPEAETAQQRNFATAKEQGFPGNFNDWMSINKAIASAQNDPRARDPYSGVSMPQVLPEYMKYYGVNPKVFQWYKKNPSGAEALVSGTAPGAAQGAPTQREASPVAKKLKGKASGQYRVGDTIVDWDGERIIRIRRGITQ
jgi:hypothetical protein